MDTKHSAETDAAPPPDEWFTPVGAGAHLKVSPKHLENLRGAEEEPGQLGPDYRRFGRLIRYRRSDLDAWAEAQR